MLQTSHMFLASALIKNLHAVTFASMLMKSSGLLHEAVRVPFSICKLSLAYFETGKGFFLSILRQSKKYAMLIKKECTWKVVGFLKFFIFPG